MYDTVHVHSCMSCMSMSKSVLHVIFYISSRTKLSLENKRIDETPRFI